MLECEFQSAGKVDIYCDFANMISPQPHQMDCYKIIQKSAEKRALKNNSKKTDFSV